jgi:hypothetical protein
MSRRRDARRCGKTALALARIQRRHLELVRARGEIGDRLTRRGSVDRLDEHERPPPVDWYSLYAVAPVMAPHDSVALDGGCAVAVTLPGAGRRSGVGRTTSFDAGESSMPTSARTNHEYWVSE